MKTTRTRQAHLGDFPMIISQPQSAGQALAGAEVLLYSIALSGIFPPCFSSYYSNSQLCVVRNYLLSSTLSVILLDFFFFTTTELTFSETYQHLSSKHRLSVQSLSLYTQD